jgi:hypothetical protein
MVFARYGRPGGGLHGRGGFYGRPHWGGHAHFYGHPGFYTHVVIGPDPFFYGPYPYWWGPYVYSWDYGYYPDAPSADILRLGLPQGELLPGARVSGFIYFQHAARQPGRLDLTWNARGTDGRAIASVTAPMRVVSD